MNDFDEESEISQSLVGGNVSNATVWFGSFPALRDRLMAICYRRWNGWPGQWRLVARDCGVLVDLTSITLLEMAPAEPATVQPTSGFPCFVIRDVELHSANAGDYAWSLPTSDGAITHDQGTLIFSP